MTSNLLTYCSQSRRGKILFTIFTVFLMLQTNYQVLSDIPVPERLFFSYGEKPLFEVTHKIGFNNQVDFNSNNLIYPNPSQTFVIIKNPVLDNKSVILNIFDINSIQRHTAIMVAKSNELNIQLPTSLSNGVYFIKIIDHNENQLLLNDSFILRK